MTNPDAPLAGKVAYVTGAARGQGRCIASGSPAWRGHRCGSTRARR